MRFHIAGNSTSRPEIDDATVARSFSTTTGGTLRPPTGIVLAL